MARDAAGNLYVADRGNFTVRKVSPAGVVTTLAGLAGARGSVDGVGSAARFAAPYGVAVDGAGSVYVTDGPILAANGSVITAPSVRKISASGAVSTLPLSFFASQQFVSEFGVALDATGNLYVSLRNRVYKVSPAGAESLLATIDAFVDPLSPPTITPVVTPPPPTQPELVGIAVQADGAVYVADVQGQVIRRISPSGVVSTLAGRQGCTYGFGPTPAGSPCGPYDASAPADGMGDAARFTFPRWIAFDAAGDLLVVDNPRTASGNFSGSDPGRVLRKVTAAGVVTTVASGLDGLGGLVIDGQGVQYMSDLVNARILKKLPDQVTTVLAGPSQASGTNMFLNVATDAQGGVYALQRSIDRGLVPTANSYTRFGLRLVKISSQGETTALAEGFGGFWLPRGALAVDRSGNAYSTKAAVTPPSGFVREVESGGSIIKVTPSGTTSTLWSTADFVPARVVVDASGTLYVSGYDNGTGFGPTTNATPYVVRLSSTGQVLGQWPYAPAGTVNREVPEIALDTGGNLIVATDNTIRKISPAGVVSVLAGVQAVPGSTDGVGDQARFGVISAVAVDAAGNLYAADATHNTVRKITPAGTVTTLVGKAGSTGILLGDLPASLATPNGLAIDASGFLYISAGQALLRVKLP
jgi:sugar lactone lactonase YvrE